MRIALIGVPTNSSGTTDGVSRAPEALRQAGLIEALAKHIDIVDFGDVAFLKPSAERSSKSGIIAEESLASMITAVKQTVDRALSENYFPLVIGGDCPLLLGAFGAAQNLFGSLGLIFIDGHEDAYPPHQSPSGEAADMELGLMLSVAQSNVSPSLSAMLPSIKPSDLVIFGARDAEILRSEGVRSLADRIEMYTDSALQKMDLLELTSQATQRLSAKNNSLWLHIDLDVLSTASLPAVDYQQPGGLTWEQLESLTATALASGEVIGWNVTIYNPDLDPARASAKRIVQFLEKTIAILA